MEYVCFERHNMLFLELFADEVKGSVSGVCVRARACILFFLTWCLLLPVTSALLGEFSHQMF